MYPIVRALAFVLIPVPFILGCGEKRADTASADSAVAADSAALEETGVDTAAAAPAATTATAGTSTDESSRPVTVEDIDRWQQGMTAEMEAVKEKAAKLKTAGTGEEKMSIMMELNEQTTAPIGAKAAGLEENRYEFVRAKLSDAVKWLAPLEFGTGTPQIKETEQMRAERESYFKQMAWAVPPDVVEALKPRAAELSKQEWRLVAARVGK